MTFDDIIRVHPQAEEMAAACAMRLSLAEVITLERNERDDTRGMVENDYRALRADKCVTTDEPPQITQFGIAVRRAARRIESAGTPSLF